MNDIDKKHMLYDQILAKLMQNVQSEDHFYNGIYVNGYVNNPICNTYMKMVDGYADITDKKVTMIMPLYQYIPFILKRWKARKRYKRVRVHPDHAIVPIVKIAMYVAEHFGESLSVYEDIEKEYYS